MIASLTRRDALSLSLMATLTAASGNISRAFASTINSRQSFIKANAMPFGVQLYALGPELAHTLNASLAILAQAGFETVEPAGYLGRTATQLRVAFDHAGLRCTSAHFGSPQPGPEPNLITSLGRVIDDAHILGLEYVVTPIFRIPDRYASGPATDETTWDYMRRVARGMTIEDWKRTAHFLNITGEQLKHHGLTLAYHNHNPEFAPVGGTNGFEVLINYTDPHLVKLELDAGWAFAGGQNPATLLRAYPDRFRLVHVKDVKATTKTNYQFDQDPIEVGGGALIWPEILRAAKASGVKYYYVEQEPPFSGDRMESVLKSYKYLESIN